MSSMAGSDNLSRAVYLTVVTANVAEHSITGLLIRSLREAACERVP